MSAAFLFIIFPCLFVPNESFSQHTAIGYAEELPFNNEKQRLCRETSNLSMCLQPALIPRQQLLHPEIGGLAMSPDGRYAAYLTVSNGTDIIWSQELVQHSNPQVVIAEQNSKIGYLEWTCSPGIVLYNKDTDGDENYRLYSINITDRNQLPRRLTSEGARSLVHSVNCKYADTLIVKSNDREPRYFDLYKLNLKTGTRSLLYQNDAFMEFMLDNDMKLRLASTVSKDGGVDYYEIENSTWSIKWKLYTHIEFGDDMTNYFLSFDASNNRIYWQIAVEDLVSLYVTEFETPMKRQLIYKAKSADAAFVVFNKRTTEPMMVMEDDGYPVYYALDPIVQDDLERLRSLAPKNARFLIWDTSYDFTKWLVWWRQDDQPPVTSIYDRESKSIVHNFELWPSLNRFDFAKTKPLSIITRDAFVQLCYLTVPIEYVPEHSHHHTTQPIPMVLLVHGGPWARDTWRFDSTKQFLANRGYGVLECNYRASVGFGKVWINAGNGEWGRKMHYDLLDAVDWAVQDGVADRDRIAIMGASYGGYATLVGMTETPDTFACGIDIVGPSNLETMLRTEPAYWVNGRKQEEKRIGGTIDTEEGLAFLHSRSPYYSAHKIKRPLLIFHGANDPRVIRNESDSIVSAMQAANIPVTYVLFPDEGHGFRKDENRAAQMAITEQFLKKCLNGRAEEFRDDVHKSSAQIISTGTLEIS